MYRTHITIPIDVEIVKLIERDAKKAGMKRAGFLTDMVEKRYKEEIEKKSKIKKVS